MQRKGWQAAPKGVLGASRALVSLNITWICNAAIATHRAGGTAVRPAASASSWAQQHRLAPGSWVKGLNFSLRLFQAIREHRGKGRAQVGLVPCSSISGGTVPGGMLG